MIAFIMDRTNQAWSSAMIRPVIIDAINNNGGKLPSELSDIFKLTPIVGNIQHPENAWRIDWV